jgi:sulfur carrier protein ThiS
MNKAASILSIIQFSLVLVSCGPENHIRQLEQESALEQLSPFGCMHEQAENYNPLASLPSGDCNFSYCSTPNSENFNLDLDLAVKAYQDHLKDQGISFIGSINDQYQCGKAKGCTITLADNYDGPDFLDNGACVFNTCVDPTAANYIGDDDAQVINDYLDDPKNIDAVLNSTCEAKVGCAMEGFINYDEHNIENGTCELNYCGQIGTENYSQGSVDLVEQYKNYLADLNIPIEDGHIQDNIECGGTYGCTVPGFANYDPENPATIEDASCELAYCGTEGTKNYNQEKANLVKNYEDLLKQLGLEKQEGKIQDNLNCGGKLGCTFEGFDNYDNNDPATAENGSCKLDFCGKENTENFNSEKAELVKTYEAYLKQMGIEQIPGQIRSDINCGEALGCNYPGFPNSKSNVKENGSCNVIGCAQEGYENYDEGFLENYEKYLRLLMNSGLTHTGDYKADQCGKKLGCTYSSANNYDEANELDTQGYYCQFSFCSGSGEAEDVQAEADYIKYKSDHPDAPDYIDTCIPQQTDSFTQGYGGKADILFVVDNSGSMGDDQINLANNFDFFIQHFISTEVEFKMAITTSDSNYVENSIEQLTWEMAAQNQTQFIDTFTNMIQVGTRGSAHEEPFEGTEDFFNSVGQNWLRNDAYLFVIYVSDEDEQSDMTQLAHLNFLKAKKNNILSLMQVSAIMNPSDTTGRYAYITQETSGSLTSIYTDFSSTLSNIAQGIMALLDTFTLTQVPDPSTIVVTVDGQVIAADYWNYNASTNQIIFVDGHEPMDGAEINISYFVQVSQP